MYFMKFYGENTSRYKIKYRYLKILDWFWLRMRIRNYFRRKTAIIWTYLCKQLLTLF